MGNLIAGQARLLVVGYLGEMVSLPPVWSPGRSPCPTKKSTLESRLVDFSWKFAKLPPVSCGLLRALASEVSLSKYQHTSEKIIVRYIHYYCVMCGCQQTADLDHSILILIFFSPAEKYFEEGEKLINNSYKKDHLQ